MAKGAGKPRRVAVTGATGVVGQFVVNRLLREGVSVVAATHSTDTQIVHPNIRWQSFALDSPDKMRQLLTGCDSLVHCAFSHAPGRYRGGEASDPVGFWQQNLGGTIGLLDGCVKLGVSRVLLLSSRAVFGDDQHGTADDGSTATPDTHYGALKAAEESLAKVIANKHALLCASLRPTGVYGVLNDPRTSKWWGDVAGVARGRPVPQYREGTEVHGNDVADALWRLLCAPASSLQGQAYNCSDLQVTTRMLAQQLNELTEQELPLPNLPLQQTLKRGPTLRCSGLEELGWQPGGEEQLRNTLQQLLQLVKRSASAGNELTV